MIDLGRIKKPTMLLDEGKCMANIERMTSKAKNSGVNFRPHFKTHQSRIIGEWFRKYGTASITVSSVTMAKYFAEAGWNDITIAFPANIRESDDINYLSGISRLNLLTTDHDHYSLLNRRISSGCGCFLKINTGNNRSGTEWNDASEIKRITGSASKSSNLRLKGLLTHAGHSYKAASTDELVQIYNSTVSMLNAARDAAGDNNLILSSGDTPCCSVVDSFTGLDEVRPGNFVFYDLMQVKLTSCSRDSVAVAVACPVVEKNISRREIIIYGGGVHLSKDSLRLADGRMVYGQVVFLGKDGWIFPEEDTYLRSISQEHGIISAPGSIFDKIKTGDLIGIIPVHSCMTADLLREYHTLTGDVISDFSPK